MNNFLKQFGTIFLLVLAACGNSHKSPSRMITTPDRDKSDQTPGSEPYDFGPVSISKGMDLPYDDKYGFILLVTLDGDLQGNCAYDNVLDLTYLKIQVGIRSPGSSDKYSVFTSDPSERKPVIFAKGNLCEIKYPYDYQEADILLKTEPEAIKIGKFLPLSIDGISPNSTTPLICEENYSEICTIKFGGVLPPKKNSDHFSGVNLDYSGTVTLELFKTAETYIAYTYQH